jgi:transposase
VVLGNKEKEPVSAKGAPNDGIKIVKELAKYQGKGKTVQATHEAGCLGYTRYRTLEEFGIDCRVIPPNTVFHGGDEAVKTDYRDASNRGFADIAWMPRREERESIAIPTKEDEAVRDLLRHRGDLKENLKSVKRRFRTTVR